MKSIQEIEAGLELDSDEEILRAQLGTANARIAELERVQGMLVAECKKAITWIDDEDAIARFRAAIAVAQKPASLRDMTEADFETVFGVGAQKPAANLWAIHIPGPDEYHAAPSEEAAQAMAKQLNADMARLFADRPITPATPSIASVTASVVPWPSDAESHAKALIEFDASEWGIEQKPEGGDRD